MTTHPPIRATAIASSDLNHHLAAVLDRVESGESLAVTRHGVVVAVLSPARPHPLAPLVDAGLVEPAAGFLFPTEPR